MNTVFQQQNLMLGRNGALSQDPAKEFHPSDPVVEAL